MTFVILLIVVLIAAVISAKFLRSRKRRDVGMNRYRVYRPKRYVSPRVRPNRYHRQSQREPSLGYKHSSGLEDSEEPVAELSPTPKEKEKIDPDIVLGLKEEVSVAGKLPAISQIALKPASMAVPIVTFHVMALEGRPYSGYELLQAILSVGMRYGKHQIFHRHREKTGRGPVLFSLSSATRPGYFDLSKMGGFSTQGLSLFFKADKVNDPLAVYELMLQTTDWLVEGLGGHVLDENYELVTPARVVEQRKLLREYCESQCMSDLFEAIED